MNKRKNEHAFSIELQSKSYLSLEQPRDVEGAVLIEGTLGGLQSLTFVEGIMVELVGSRGILRLDISETEWNQLLRKEGKE